MSEKESKFLGLMTLAEAAFLEEEKEEKEENNVPAVVLSLINQEESSYVIPVFSGIVKGCAPVPCVIELHATFYALFSGGVCEECCKNRAGHMRWFRWKSLSRGKMRLSSESRKSGWCGKTQVLMTTTAGYSALAKRYPVRWLKESYVITYQQFINFLANTKTHEVVSKELKRCQKKHE